MTYIELALVVVCVVAILQAIGRGLPIPMAVLQIAAGVALSSVAALDDIREQSSLLFVMLVPPLLYVEAWQVRKRERLRSIGPVLGLAIAQAALRVIEAAPAAAVSRTVREWATTWKYLYESRVAAM